jgi:hypothetical protein
VGEGLFRRLQGELAAREKSPGLTMRDVLNMPSPLDRLAQWMLREEQFTAEGVAEVLGGDEARAAEVVADWLDKGYIRDVTVRGETTYAVRTASRRPREIPLDLWAALQNKVEE